MSAAAKQKQNISMTIVTRWLDHIAIFYGGHRKNQQWGLSLVPTMANSPHFQHPETGNRIPLPRSLHPETKRLETV